MRYARPDNCGSQHGQNTSVFVFPLVIIHVRNPGGGVGGAARCSPQGHAGQVQPSAGKREGSPRLPGFDEELSTSVEFYHDSKHDTERSLLAEDQRQHVLWLVKKQGW